MTAADDLSGKRVTVVGLGVLGGGVGVARYLAGQGAHVTVTDMRDAADLATSVQALDGLPITFHLGGHDVQDFLPDGADIIVRNPGVPRRAALLDVAREHGIPIEMEMSLFFRACPAPVIGVTGTKGKTTVSMLIGDMLKQWQPGSVVAGNMGISALAALDHMTPETPTVIELSSWQLEAMDEHGLGPAIAVLTNIHEDHLTHYDGFDDYAATKRSIARHLGPSDVVVYNADQDETVRVAGETQAMLLPFSANPLAADGVWAEGETILARWRGIEHRFPRPRQLALSGPAGVGNAMAAIAAAIARGVPHDAVATGLDGFVGVPDRLETVATCCGATFINDTSATAPVAAAATIRLLAGMHEHLVVIAGGADKASDFQPMAEAIAETGVTLVLLDGTGTDRLRASLERVGVATDRSHEALEPAFASAMDQRDRPLAVALSPGCASFGMFRNEFERGEQFRQLSRAWCEKHSARGGDTDGPTSAT